MRIAVIGMGKMGHAVAGRLLDAGHDVTVWNRSPGRADDLVERGATEAAAAAEAVVSAEVVLVSLADDAAVLSVATGEEGVASALGESAVLVDMSTVSPETAARLAELTGGRSLAGPILGAPAAVEAGRAVYLVAGPKEQFERLAPVYGALSEDVRYLGEERERALQLKLLANYLLLAGLVVLSETVATAQAVGFPEDSLRQFLDSSPLVAPGLRNRLDALFSGKHASWFTTPLGAKDVGLAEQMATREALRLPVAELVKRRYEEAAAAGFADEDLTAVIELVRSKAR